MNNTVVQFELVKIENETRGFEIIVDPTSLHINGKFNWLLLNDFLFNGKIDGHLMDIVKDLELYQSKRITLEIWEDSDDEHERSWIDYEVLKVE